MSDDILPCPFCGAEADTFKSNGVLQATCDDFNCPAFDVFAPIFLWNRRPKVDNRCPQPCMCPSCYDQQ